MLLLFVVEIFFRGGGGEGHCFLFFSRLHKTNNMLVDKRNIIIDSCFSFIKNRLLKKKRSYKLWKFRLLQTKKTQSYYKLPQVIKIKTNVLQTATDIANYD